MVAEYDCLKLLTLRDILVLGEPNSFITDLNCKTAPAVLQLVGVFYKVQKDVDSIQDSSLKNVLNMSMLRLYCTSV